MPININGTTGISGADGSAATPAIQGADTNTGIFFPAADTVAIATGGAERARVDSSGNVGIGTSSPTAKLNVVSSGSAAAYTVTGIVEDNTYPGSGNSTLEFRGFIAGNGYRSGVGSIGGQSLAFYTPSTYGVAPTERARIDSNGHLYITATTTPSSTVVGTKFSNLNTDYHRMSLGSYTGAGDFIHFINGNGSVGRISVSGSSTSYVTTSDYRLKENVQPMTGALAKVAALKPCTYTWKADGSAGEGFIAHELQAVVPDCVTGEKDAVDADGNPVYQGIDTSFLVATLTAAIQELKAIVDAQAVEIAALKGAA